MDLFKVIAGIYIYVSHIFMWLLVPASAIVKFKKH